ncbi:DNA (cytosine-5-)-methyltransferase [Mesorhizobium sp. KR1-2]|uniref:DNA cytosine methyltransferase n=1 Tax=Mesorhizobium sp. KR1-2 TaxID=3156609 RepID=UPI0032B4EE5C
MQIKYITRTRDDVELPRLRVLSLCSGIGGDVAALEYAGIPHDVAAVAEIDPIASAVLAQKFPSVPNLGDLTLADWSNYHDNIDVLIAGIPCQPYSVAGRQRGVDDRRDVTSDIVRIVGEVRPRYVLFENVAQYETLHGGKAFSELRNGLVSCGYAVDHRVIDAAEVLPQRRKRLFILGCRGDAGGSPSQILADAASGGRSADACGTTRLPSADATSGSASVLHPPRLGTLMASGSGMNRPGMRGHELDFLVVQEFPQLGLVMRRPTPLEALRAQGFPDDWFDGVSFAGKALTDIQKYKLIGNSWPVPVTAAILASVFRSSETGRLSQAA